MGNKMRSVSMRTPSGKAKACQERSRAPEKSSTAPEGVRFHGCGIKRVNPATIARTLAIGRVMPCGRLGSFSIGSCPTFVVSLPGRFQDAGDLMLKGQPVQGKPGSARLCGRIENIEQGDSGRRGK